MQVLTAFPKEILSQFNRVSNIFTDFSAQITADSVALVVEGENFSSNLSTAAELNIPVVVIAGLKSTGQKYMQEAQEYGIPERCIIFKDQNNIISADGYKYGESPKGINIKMLTEIADHALKNQLFPELYIWKEPDLQVWPSQKQPKQELQKPSKQEPAQDRQQDPPKPENNHKSRIKHILSEDLSVFLTKAQVLAVFKSVPTINSAPVAKVLAEKLNGIHLEINNEPRSFQQYAPSKEKAMQESYAFSNGKSVSYGASEFKWIIVEINPSMLDVMGAVYGQAAKTIYVVENFDESEPALDMWIDGGYKLDAIIPDSINMAAYKEKYGDKVYELDRFVSQFERR